MTNILVQCIQFKRFLFEAHKYYFVFDSRFIFHLFVSSYIHNVVSMLPNVVKIDVQNNNVVCSNQRWNR